MPNRTTLTQQHPNQTQSPITQDRANIVYELYHPRFITQQHHTFRTFEQAQQLAKTLSQHCPDSMKIEIGLNELFLNAIEHGNLGITYEEKSQALCRNEWIKSVNNRLFLPENKNKFVKVLFQQSPDKIIFSIKDLGQGFDWQDYIPPEYNRDYHGRGITIAKEFAFDELEYNAKGNEVNCTILLS